MKSVHTIVLVTVIALSVLAEVAQSQPEERDLKLRARQTLLAFCTAIDVFKMDCGVYPPQDQGLQSLIKNPGVGNWNGPYIKSKGGGVPKDPWGTPYRYRLIKKKYRLDSAGPDKRFGTDDDVTADQKKSSNNGVEDIRR